MPFSYLPSNKITPHSPGNAFFRVNRSQYIANVQFSSLIFFGQHNSCLGHVQWRCYGGRTSAGNGTAQCHRNRCQRVAGVRRKVRLQVFPYRYLNERKGYFPDYCAAKTTVQSFAQSVGFVRFDQYAQRTVAELAV